MFQCAEALQLHVPWWVVSSILTLHHPPQPQPRAAAAAGLHACSPVDRPIPFSTAGQMRPRRWSKQNNSGARSSGLEQQIAELSRKAGASGGWWDFELLGPMDITFAVQLRKTAAVIPQRPTVSEDTISGNNFSAG